MEAAGTFPLHALTNELLVVLFSHRSSHTADRCMPAMVTFDNPPPSITLALSREANDTRLPRLSELVELSAVPHTVQTFRAIGETRVGVGRADRSMQP